MSARCRLALVLAGTLAAAPAAAQQERPLMVFAGQSFSWDSNLFKLPDSVDPQAQLGRSEKSDYWSATSLGLRLDQPYAQQRFLVDATVTATRYQRFTHLDFDALQYRAAWNWQLTPRVTGTMSAERSESLVNYADFRNVSQQNVRTSETQRFSAEAWLEGGWYVLGAVSHQKSENSVTFLQERSFSATGVESGFRYLARSGSSASFILRTDDGQYAERPLDPVNLIDDGFERQESELTASWIVTGRSTLLGRLAWIDFRSNNFAQRDFSGAAGRLGWRWQPTGRLSLEVVASRDLSPQSDAFTYRSDERLSVSPAWQLTAKTMLRMGLERVESDFRRPILPGAAREDRLSGASLAAEWKPLRNLTVSASVQHQRRSSSDPAFGFSADSATLGATLLF